MCEILQSCENTHMHREQHIIIFSAILAVYFCILAALYYIDIVFGSYCTYSSIPDHHYE